MGTLQPTQAFPASPHPSDRRLELHLMENFWRRNTGLQGGACEIDIDARDKLEEPICIE